MSRFDQNLLPPVSRSTYWISMAVLIAVFIGLSISQGLYYTQLPAENLDQQLRPADALSKFLYSPLGNALMITVMQYLLANVVFWPTLWLWQKIRGKGQ